MAEGVHRTTRMTNRMATVFVGLSLLMFTASRSFAHEGHDHKLMGTVVVAAADHLVLKDTTGKDVTIRVSPETRVKSNPPMKVEQIKPLTRVVVTAPVQAGQPITAKLIEVGLVPGAGR